VEHIIREARDTLVTGAFNFKEVCVLVEHGFQLVSEQFLRREQLFVRHGPHGHETIQVHSTVRLLEEKARKACPKANVVELIVTLGMNAASHRGGNTGSSIT
jgi:hypothetical protein